MISYTKPALSQSAIKQMKREAKHTTLQQGIPYDQALDRIAQPLGYNNWSSFLKHAQTTAFAPVQLIIPESKAPTLKTWLTVTALSEAFATTIPKIRAALKHSGYIGGDGLPSTRARSLTVVEEHTIVDSYGISTGLASYYKWDRSIVNALLPPASELDQWCHVANRFQAERRMCQTFKRAGNTLNVIFNEDAEDPTNATYRGLTPAAYDALFNAHHGIMHFLGDTFSFFTSRGKKDVAKIELHVRPLIDNITKQLQLVNPAEALFFEQANTKIFHWLGKQRR